MKVVLKDEHFRRDWANEEIVTWEIKDTSRQASQQASQLAS